MTQFRRVIPLSIALIGPLLLVLIGCIETSRPTPPTALARPANVPAAVGQIATELPDGYDQIAQPEGNTSSRPILTNAGAGTDNRIHVLDGAAFASGTATPPVIAVTSRLSPMATASTADRPSVYAATSDISYTLYLPVITKNGGAQIRAVRCGFWSQFAVV